VAPADEVDRRQQDREQCRHNSPRAAHVKGRYGKGVPLKLIDYQTGYQETGYQKECVDADATACRERIAEPVSVPSSLPE
jgi:hypothetical protein